MPSNSAPIIIIIIIIILIMHHHLSPAANFLPSPSPPSFRFTLGTSQIFQNFKFSSPAPVATVVPSGLSAEHSTRASCAGTSYIFCSDG
jgi:hypothetical protein